MKSFMNPLVLFGMMSLGATPDAEESKSQQQRFTPRIIAFCDTIARLKDADPNAIKDCQDLKQLLAKRSDQSWCAAQLRSAKDEDFSLQTICSKDVIVLPVSKCLNTANSIAVYNMNLGIQERYEVLKEIETFITAQEIKKSKINK